jgi:thioredoxin-like negative regulator of GroEL
MEKHLRAVIDHHLSKARSATTMEEMKAEYEEAITGILNAYKAVLAIVKVGLKNDLLIDADEGTKH